MSSLASALRVYPNVRTISLEAFRVELADSPLLKIQDIENFEEEFEYNKKRRNEKKLKSIHIKMLLFILFIYIY